MERNKRILIVEDDDAAALINEIVVKEMKYAPIRAENGRVALDYVNNSIRTEESFSLILLDVGLPEVSGMDVAEELFNNPDTAHIPIMLITVLGTDKAVSEKAKELKNIRVVLKKPVGFELIREKIKEILGDS